MFLSNQEIQNYIQEGKITVEGDVKIENIGITANLGEKLLLPIPSQTIDLSNPIQPKYDTHDLTISPYTLKPNEFVLGATMQRINTNKEIITMIDGRSTLARLGLTIHLSAMVLDGIPFNKENSVLEIKNLGNFEIILHAGERVGTYIFAKLSSPISGERESMYMNQNGVTPPRFI